MLKEWYSGMVRDIQPETNSLYSLIPELFLRYWNKAVVMWLLLWKFTSFFKILCSRYLIVSNSVRHVLVCVVLASEGSLERPASQLCQVPSFLRLAHREPLSVPHTSHYTNPCCQPFWLYSFYLGCRQKVWPSLSNFWAIQNICNPLIYFTFCK